jgi:hypothetical protein
MPHRARRAHLFPIGGGDAGAFLPAMLQRVETEVGQVRSFGIPEDTKHSTLVFIWHSLAPPALAFVGSPVDTLAVLDLYPSYAARDLK